MRFFLSSHHLLLLRKLGDNVADERPAVSLANVVQDVVDTLNHLLSRTSVKTGLNYPWKEKCLEQISRLDPAHVRKLQLVWGFLSPSPSDRISTSGAFSLISNILWLSVGMISFFWQNWGMTSQIQVLHSPALCCWGCSSRSPAPPPLNQCVGRFPQPCNKRGSIDQGCIHGLGSVRKLQPRRGWSGSFRDLQCWRGEAVDPQHGHACLSRNFSLNCSSLKTISFELPANTIHTYT